MCLGSTEWIALTTFVMNGLSNDASSVGQPTGGASQRGADGTGQRDAKDGHGHRGHRHAPVGGQEGEVLLDGVQATDERHRQDDEPQAGTAQRIDHPTTETGGLVLVLVLDVRGVGEAQRQESGADTDAHADPADERIAAGREQCGGEERRRHLDEQLR